MTTTTTQPAASVERSDASALLHARYGDARPDGRIPLNDVLAVQLAHRSVRSYLPDPVDEEHLRAIVAAAQSAPTSSNLQLWSVVAVTAPEVKARLAALAGGQRHIVQAPLLLVWVADYARGRSLAERADAPTEAADYLETTLVGFVDAALAAQNAVVAAESLGLGTVYIGAVRNDPDGVIAALGLPEGAFPVVGLVVGHPDPAGGEEVKPRLPQEAVLHREGYDLDGQLELIEGYDRRIGSFYAAQGLEGGWTGRILDRLRSPRSLNGRERIREALARHGFPSR